MRKSCRARKVLQSARLLTKFGIDTAENEPSKIWQNLVISLVLGKKKGNKLNFEFVLGAAALSCCRAAVGIRNRMMNVVRTRDTKHILNANCYDVAPISRGSNLRSCVPKVHHSQEDCIYIAVFSYTASRL